LHATEATLGYYWLERFGLYYAMAGLVMLWLGVAYVAAHTARAIYAKSQKNGAVEFWSYILLAPCIFVFMTVSHHVNHEFAVIKFAAFFAVMPCLVFLTHWQNGRFRAWAYAMSLAILGGYVGFLLGTKGWGLGFAHQTYPTYIAEKYIYKNAGYNDLVFSPNYKNEMKAPTQTLAVAMKRVYKVRYFNRILAYEINDYRNKQMLPYGIEGEWRLLPVAEAENIYLMIMKTAPCWPLSTSTGNFLKANASLVHEDTQMVYYRLQADTLEKNNDQICIKLPTKAG